MATGGALWLAARAINGAGIAGTALAYWLSKLGHEVLLVERALELRTGGFVLNLWGYRLRRAGEATVGIGAAIPRAATAGHGRYLPVIIVNSR